MTENANFKRRVRARAERTGESYATARSHLVPEQQPEVTIATARVALRPDPGSREQLRASGADVRELMRQARAAGAELIHFPEGALTSPHKKVMSSTGPDDVGEADWSRVHWDTLEQELESVIQSAAELQLWTVVGSVRLADSPRPTNCIYVISPSGALVDRYDERMLSPTKARLMYERGSRAVVFQAGGLTFGVVSGMETQYPELVSEYEAAGVDCVLFSTAGNPQQPGLFAVEASGLAAANSLWISYAGGVGAEHHQSGMIAPDGQWAARSDVSGAKGLVLTTIGATAGDGSRAWRRHARSERVG